VRAAIIPARGGSKRIPRKNIRPFFGKPMIGWSIEAAIASGCFDRIIVSTDDPDIASTAQGFGAEAPFVRPPELSGDHVGMLPVMAHAVRWLEEHNATATAVCCIYATAPFLTAAHLREGLRVLLETGSDHACAVTRFEYPVQRALRITGAGRIEMFDESQFHTRSQDLEAAYHDAAQFCWGSAEAWKQERRVFSAGSCPVVLPRYLVQDIDSPDDWDRAERMFASMTATIAFP
jgi:N-acylneuraminate cytidylyltransferase